MAIAHRYHVAAGTFHISERMPLVLQAYLGTCVGLALHCKSTGIGGMIHLLLPEPVSGTTSQPEKYAATGVPMFIEALLEKGAKREALVAGIAGGALVGPISEQDLSLDIGGRTAEVVRKILSDYDITVEQSETGGFFTCCLNLDMKNGACTIEPAGIEKIKGDENVVLPKASDIKKSMDRLQPIPQVALKVLRMIDEGRYTIDKIADEIRKDQVITARTLSFANSAMFGKKRPIESLDHALVYLGQDQLVKVIISAAVQSYFVQSSTGYSLCKGGLYHHAIGCAQVAEAIAIKTELAAPSKAYTAGLLHDIGKVVLDQHIASVYPLFYRQTIEQQKEHILTIEQKLLGTDHTQIGHSLAQQWSIPDSLSHTVQNHHYPGKETEHQTMAVIVYLADLLLSRFHIGFELERVETKKLATHLNHVGLAIDEFAQLVDLIPNTVLKAMADAA